MKDLTNEKEATLKEMLDYLCSKIDFDHSFLDGAAVQCMNILFMELSKQEEKYQID